MKLNKLLGILLITGFWLTIFINHSGLVKPLFNFGVELPSENKTVSWKDGTAQEEFENRLMQHSIARTYFLRLRNQYQYSLFNRINAADIYEYNNTFFRFYQYTFNERWNFKGVDTLQQRVSELKQLQQLIGEDTPIITIIAPNKAQYFKERLPEWNQTTTEITNYNYIRKQLPKENLHIIDFNDYFLKHKSASPAIFANGGIHWTNYASTLAMDSVIRYISRIKQIEFDRFKFETKNCNGFNVDDLDIALLRNLITKPKDTAIREINYFPQTKTRKLKAIVVGDSFFQVIQSSEMRHLIFTNDTDYHYYFTTTFDSNYQAHTLDIQKIKEQLKNVDCVILISGVVNLENFGFGFPGTMNKAFTID